MAEIVYSANGTTCEIGADSIGNPPDFLSKPQRQHVQKQSNLLVLNHRAVVAVFVAKSIVVFCRRHLVILDTAYYTTYALRVARGTMKFQAISEPSTTLPNPYPWGIAYSV